MHTSSIPNYAPLISHDRLEVVPGVALRPCPGRSDEGTSSAFQLQHLACPTTPCSPLDALGSLHSKQISTAVLCMPLCVAPMPISRTVFEVVDACARPGRTFCSIFTSAITAALNHFEKKYTSAHKRSLTAHTQIPQHPTIGRLVSVPAL